MAGQVGLDMVVLCVYVLLMDVEVKEEVVLLLVCSFLQNLDITKVQQRTLVLKSKMLNNPHYPFTHTIHTEVRQ